MIRMNDNKRNNLFDIVYLVNDQPTTCGKCGSRTNVIFDLSHSNDGTQIHECLSESCKAIFVTMEDKEFTTQL
jgi:hypothetical protein